MQTYLMDRWERERERVENEHLDNKWYYPRSLEEQEKESHYASNI